MGISKVFTFGGKLKKPVSSWLGEWLQFVAEVKMVVQKVNTVTVTSILGHRAHLYKKDILQIKNTSEYLQFLSLLLLPI